MRSLYSAAACLSFISVLVPASSALGAELFPGRIKNSGGLQQFTAAVYNPDLDEYAIGYTGVLPGESAALPARPLVAIVSTAGVFQGGREVALAGHTGATHIALSYNADRGEYLAVWRNGDPATLSGRYLSNNLTTLGPAFTFPQLGADPSVAYSPDSGLFMVTYTQNLGSGTRRVLYHMVSGNSTTPGIVGTTELTRGSVLSDVVSYGTLAQKFLIVYVKDTPPPFRANITGAFVGPTGVLENSFAIDNSPDNQQIPDVTYSEAINRWVVGYEDWENVGARSADFKGALVAPTGAVTSRFFFTASGQWDFPGQLTYNAKTGTVLASWRIARDVAPQALAREFAPADGVGANPLGPPILLSDQDAFPLAATSRTVGSDPQALFLWKLKNGGDGIHAGIVHLPPVQSKFLHIGKPKNNSARLSPFTVKGWAVDVEAPAGTGVDAVHVYYRPAAGGADQILGVANYGTSKPGVAALFDDPRFEPSGFELVDAALPDGDYVLTVFSRSTESGEFDTMADIALHVGPDPRMSLDKPKANAVVQWPFEFGGWAIDRAAPSGVGVDAVHFWATPEAGGDPIFMGEAVPDSARAGVAALYGSQFEASGYKLSSPTVLPPGNYMFSAHARSTTTGTFDDMREVPVVVEARTVMSFDRPKEGSIVGTPFKVSGWAFNTGEPGVVGVNAVHVWAFPANGDPAFRLGKADLGLSRPDIASIFGVPEFEPSGFRLDVIDPIPLGAYVLRVYVRDTITNTFATVQERNVVVASNPQMVVDTPKDGTPVTFPFKVAGWAVDLPAQLGPGVDAVHVWAFPSLGGAPIMLGAATVGKSRPGVATMFGDPSKELSGYRLDVLAGALPSGSYTLGVFAHSTVTGTFNNSVFLTITVP